jgi:hypothetical protein
MKSYWIVGIVPAILLASCGPVQPTLTPPTVMSAVVSPSPTFTVTPLPTATVTPVPPTATPTSTAMPTAIATPTSTATPTPTATATLQPTATPTLPAFLLTQDFPPIPTGKGALIVVNHLSRELGLDIGSRLYKIPGLGRMLIFLSPGHYTFSLTIPGYRGYTGATEIVESYYIQQDY